MHLPLARLLEAEEKGDAVADVLDPVGRLCCLGSHTRGVEQGRQQSVDLGERRALVIVVLRREQPADVQRSDEVDHGVVATRREAAALYAHPALAVDRADLVVVVLAVATVVIGDPAHEGAERQRRRAIAPGERERAGEPRVVGLCEDDRPTPRTKQAEAAKRLRARAAASPRRPEAATAAASLPGAARAWARARARPPPAAVVGRQRPPTRR